MILAVLFWAAWKHPLTAGIGLLVLAAPLAIAYVGVLVVNDLPLTWALVIALPPVLTGFSSSGQARQERSSP